MQAVPEGLSPVTNFDKQRYLGTWYEIARYDHPFERGLDAITATYNILNDGAIEVINRGVDSSTGEIDEASGKAYFVQNEQVGHLKVSFFGPFYASYVVVALDEQDYQWALVTGPTREYFWILSRTSDMQKELLNELISMAEDMGFQRSKLIFVNHDKNT